METTKTPSGSISTWIVSLQDGDRTAFAKIWKRYSSQLAANAEQRLPTKASRLVSGDDVAQSVFMVVWKAAESGRLQKLETRHELWWLLIAIAQRKVIDRVRSETALKRGAGRVDDESTLAWGSGGETGFSLDSVVGEDPTPDLLAAMEEEYHYLMTCLPDENTRRIASARIEGYEAGEIASQMNVGKRTVERKLKLIRGRWSGHLDSPCYA